MQAKLWTAVLVPALLSAVAGRLNAQQDQVKQQDSGIESQAPGSRSTLLTLKLKDRLLRDVVQSIRRKAGVNIIIDPAIEETVTIDLEDVEWRKALELVAEAAGCVVVEEAGNVLKVEKPPRVYFAFENADIQNVIDTIAKISGANIMVAPEVQGTITLRLRNIPWRDALEASAKTLGYVVVEEERGILRVIPPSAMKADLVTEAFQLRYVRPKSTYVPFLQSPYVRNMQPQQQQQLQNGQVQFLLLDALRRTLTPDIGSLEYFEGNNVIIIKDTKPVVEEVRRIITGVDIEPGQIFIDVKFVTTTNSDILDYGVRVGDNGWTASLGLGQIPTKLPFDLGAGGWDDKIIANDNGIGPFADETLNPTGDTIVPSVIYGALNFTEVTAALRLLKRDVSSEIVQAPKLIALDHQEATIFVGETIRYAQARAEQGQSGGLQLVVEEAPQSPVSTGFQLLVIPHIVPGTDKVIMDIIPKSDALSGTGTSSLAPAGFDVFTVGSGTGTGTIALPRIASSTVATKVLLRSGQTAVLGGLVTDNTSETTTQLPLLGDIPVLGWLFKNKSSTRSRVNLIVFVTPSVIRSPEEVESNLKRILDERRQQMRAEYEAIFGGSEEPSTN
jgi:type IV pilus assembly protein PilQ